MSFNWKTAFTEADPAWADAWHLEQPLRLNTLESLKHFLDLAHIKYSLLLPYKKLKNFPMVDIRELMPSFESGYYEHKNINGFSLIAFDRPIVPFTEIFQFDPLTPTHTDLLPDMVQRNLKYNQEVLESRLANRSLDQFRTKFSHVNTASLDNYSSLLPFLSTMDRAQVMGLQGGNPKTQYFTLAGIYGSFPSDLDAEVKRYGQQIGKFNHDNFDLYSQNRLFVLQHLMELYGFPVASERRTSAALFARRLHRMGERFLIRTLGQTDRTLTTIWNDGNQRKYPMVEKTTLVRAEDIDQELYSQLRDEGYFLNTTDRTIILRILYRQHKFSPDNVRQERAISIAEQEIIHPLTGRPLKNAVVIKESSNMFLRINDIVRGEYMGRIIYKRNEVVENTETDEKRLKFLFAWLSKHQRRIITYSDEFYANIEKILESYLFSPTREERFLLLTDLHKEVISKYRYIQQARKIRLLEDFAANTYKGERIGYLHMLNLSVALLHELKFEIVTYFDSLVVTAINISSSILNNRYLVRTYIVQDEEKLTEAGLEIKKQYGKLIALVDELKAIRVARASQRQSTWN